MPAHGPLSAILLNAITFTCFTCVEFKVVVIFFILILLPRCLDLEVKLFGDAHGVFSQLEVAIISLLLLIT